MGPYESIEQKQIYFCAFCNGPGVTVYKDRRVCTPCFNRLIETGATRNGFPRKQEPSFRWQKFGNGREAGYRVEVNPPLRKVSGKTSGERKRKRLYDEQEKLCYYCRLVVPFSDWTIEHLQPTSRGGKRIASNEVGACSDCNGLKGSMTEAEFRASPLFPKPPATA